MLEWGVGIVRTEEREVAREVRSDGLGDSWRMEVEEGGRE